ncbi:MAG: glycosyltransferase family 2 protein [Sphingobium sp.]|uniref:glycosyltransferase family 2 protein n=1 Tax=Sphingobium sp. TaxID=1912891 RepID=UPI000C37E291|nr:glycosyltransferase family 2 protein [Sphingobium sp.]MBU0658064.1 glycosyltransferase family 2 protein [Alphaproteobacteria bacterium]MBA4754625.1 glycosyltransferase family 2 protein [Sphingobium sp.]MBS87931.1 histidine kinase [Sphingobium sp.]MBU0774865.1 glycosyltransferase family 2 protein [Alphaproteobacteria bacterium]MBU1462702.1 glycosyltransferase family 2 protein [Alphaproteobacteria bacterium]
MTDLWLGALLLVSLVAVLWPFLFYPLVLRALPTQPERPIAGPTPSASLLFCAYNEADAMPDKLANLAMLKRQHPSLELLAFDDGSSDGTGDLIAAQGDLVTLIRGPGRSGKAHGMKQLAARARGDILIFTDANVLLDPEAIDNLLARYADLDIGGVLGSLHYVGQDESATASVGSLYWRIEERLKDEESRTGNVMGADGSIFSIRRSLYPDFPDSVLDDLTVSMAVVFAGKRLVKAKDVIARERLVTARKDEYRRKVRIAARAWHTHSHLRPQLRRMAAIDRFKYASRKIIRWFGGLFILTGAVAAGALALRISPMLYLIGALVVALVIWRGIRARSGPFAALVDVLIAYAATLQGVAKAMTGRTVTIWNPAKSR